MDTGQSRFFQKKKIFVSKPSPLFSSPSPSTSFALFSSPQLLSRRASMLSSMSRVIWTLVVAVASFANTHFRNTQAHKLAPPSSSSSAPLPPQPRFPKTATATREHGDANPRRVDSALVSRRKPEMRSFSVSSKNGALMFVSPDMTWPRPRRAPSTATNAVRTKKKVAWENEPLEIACENPHYFVLWRFTQNRTIQV